MKYLVFFIKDDYFGIDIFKLAEVLNPVKLHPVPDVPEFISGVINRRGEVIPVVSMRRRFGITEEAGKARIVILRFGKGEKIGLLVDGVTEIAEIPRERISKPSSLFKGFRAEFIEGIAEMGNERIIIIMDMERVFSTEEKVLLKESKRKAEGEKSPAKKTAKKGGGKKRLLKSTGVNVKDE